jgi:hypothetical protein
MKDLARTERLVTKKMNVGKVVKMESATVASEEKTVKSGKMGGSAATTTKKMGTSEHEELETGKETARDGILSRARTV